MRTNPKGLHAERWRHTSGCGRFFNAIRHTVTDKFVMTYKAGEPKPDIVSVASEGGPAAWANRPPDQLNEKKPSSRAKKGDS
jgi:sarcosine oxidase subunit delta